jgi:hypothetical protein
MHSSCAFNCPTLSANFRGIIGTIQSAEIEPENVI